MTNAGRIVFVTVCLIFIRFIRTETNTMRTQFNGFIIEWQEFNVFQCSVPKMVDISLIGCFPPPNQFDLLDFTCLSEFELVFDERICVPTITTLSTTVMASTTILTTTESSTTPPSSTTMASTTASTTILTTTESSTTPPSSTTMASTTASTTILTTTESSTTPPSITTTVSTTPSTTITTSTVTQSILTTSQTASSTSQSTTSQSLVVTNQTSTRTSTANPEVTSVIVSSEWSTVTTTTPMSPIINYNSSSSDLVYRCPDGSLGLNCNIASDPCTMSKPCLNDATCFPNQLLPLGYRCQCQDRFSGDSCEIDERPCKETTCWNNGTCIELNSTIFVASNESDFLCECADGYEGRHCEKQIDLCVNITCENNGFCKTVDMAWQCVCLSPSLFYGNYCEIQTGSLKVFQAVSRSTAGVAIGAITLTLSFISVMDVLKYFFQIDPAKAERELKKSKINATKKLPNVAVRFQYVP